MQTGARWSLEYEEGHCPDLTHPLADNRPLRTELRADHLSPFLCRGGSPPRCPCFPHGTPLPARRPTPASLHPSLGASTAPAPGWTSPAPGSLFRLHRRRREVFEVGRTFPAHLGALPRPLAPARLRLRLRALDSQLPHTREDPLPAPEPERLPLPRLDPPRLPPPPPPPPPPGPGSPPHRRTPSAPALSRSHTGELPPYSEKGDSTPTSRRLLPPQRLLPPILERLIPRHGPLRPRLWGRTLPTPGPLVHTSREVPLGPAFPVRSGPWTPQSQVRPELVSNVLR